MRCRLIDLGRNIYPLEEINYIAWQKWGNKTHRLGEPMTGKNARLVVIAHSNDTREKKMVRPGTLCSATWMIFYNLKTAVFWSHKTSFRLGEYEAVLFGQTCGKPILSLKVLVTTIDAQWEGMGDVGSARYEPALLPPCPTIRVLSYSN